MIDEAVLLACFAGVWGTNRCLGRDWQSLCDIDHSMIICNDTTILLAESPFLCSTMAP